MDTDNYFSMLEEGANKEYEIAGRARALGFDPSESVEMVRAPDLAGRVEGLIGIKGTSELIRRLHKEGMTRNTLAFEVVKEMCTNEKFKSSDVKKSILDAVRIGLAIMTEGILVAPTEGVQGIERFRNADNSDYVAIVYAGPIRSAGGTTVALSVALTDYARKFFGIGDYKATQEETERYVEELELYHAQIVNLQYMPSADDIRTIIKNCPVCVDGLPTEEMQIGVHTNINRIEYGGKQVALTNRIRSGVALAVSSIAQKAKGVLKETKKAGLDWNWLNSVIKIVKTSDKSEKQDGKQESIEDSPLLDELVAGRPILAYPKHLGGFRLRYGRSRFTGIAAKGFSPATMIVLQRFISVGTQLKVELPGKGCIAAPVDTIEGPFVRLRSGEALRINDADTAMLLLNEVEEIIQVGDILITYGDFRKTNTPLQPSSYVEELWKAQLEKAGYGPDAYAISDREISFDEAFALSGKYAIPIHPKFLFEFQSIQAYELVKLADRLRECKDAEGKKLAELGDLQITNDPEIKKILESIAVPHRLSEGKIILSKDYAKSLVASLGLLENGEVNFQKGMNARDFDSGKYASALELANSVSVFKIPRRATFIGARIGRPEKARERLMKPSPNALFPISAYGGKERNITNAFAKDAQKFGKKETKIEIARYKCDTCKRIMATPYCYDCGKPTKVERICKTCGKPGNSKTCEYCGSEMQAYDDIEIDLEKVVNGAMQRLGIVKMPNVVKGVKRLMNASRYAEPIEKGILRAHNGIFAFKDGTSRFDATDAPMTHFYPKEIGLGLEKLRSLGYDKDYLGRPLESDTQLVELKHQDVVLNRRGAEYLLKITKYIDDLLERFYGLDAYYGANGENDLIGKLVVTLSPHTSCAVLGRIIGFTDASVGFAHPYTISARRRNADGDEDTTMLLLDALLNFSRAYLPATIGGTMDAPLLLTTNVRPEEVDDEVYAMEVVDKYPVEFYDKTMANAMPSEVNIELVESRLGNESAFENLKFTALSTESAVQVSPKRSSYTQFKTMQEKIDAEFMLMDMLDSIDKRDAAKRLIMSHFAPDLIGNLHSFSKQRFRCANCNSKYRRVPLSGKCTRCQGKLLLTISKGGIEKYLKTAINLADRYNLDNYTKQRLKLVKDEIDNVFGTAAAAEEEENNSKKQFDLSKFV